LATCTKILSTCVIIIELYLYEFFSQLYLMRNVQKTWFHRVAVASFPVISYDFSVYYPIDTENVSIMRKDTETTFFWKNISKIYQIINIFDKNFLKISKRKRRRRVFYGHLLSTCFVKYSTKQGKQHQLPKFPEKICDTC
jgi:hypothetical protein